MRIASEIILELSATHHDTCPPWPHPWDHYPFVTDGQTVWLAFRDLDPGQREQVRHTLRHLKRRLGELA
jgi:hypothetical protein